MREQIIKLKGYVDLCTSSLIQRIATKYYEDYIDSTLQTILNGYKERRNIMLETIEQYFPLGEYTKPTGGFFIWWESDNTDFNTTKILEEKIMKNDILYVPSEAFYPKIGLSYNDGGFIPNLVKKNGMRLSYSLTEPHFIEEGIKKLGILLSKSL